MNNGKKRALSVLLTLAIIIGLPIGVLGGASATNTTYDDGTGRNCVLYNTEDITQTVAIGNTYTLSAGEVTDKMSDTYGWLGYAISYACYVNGRTTAVATGSVKATPHVDCYATAYWDIAFSISSSNGFAIGANKVVVKYDVYRTYGTYDRVGNTSVVGSETVKVVSSSYTITLNILGGTPSYTVPSYSVVYGTTLADISLPNSYWTWQSATTTILPLGTNTCLAKYAVPYYTAVSGISVPVTVSKKTVSLSWAGTNSRVYDGTASSVAATAVGIISGDTCFVTVSGGTESAAGTHTATATALSNSNYALPTSKTTTYTITPRTADFVWSGSETRTYDGTASNVSASLGNLVSGDTCNVTVTGGTETNAGTFTATASSLSNSNYALPSENAVSYTIDPAAVSFDVVDTTAYYNGQPHTATVTQAATNAVEMAAGDYSISYRDSEGSTSASVTEVGTYDIIATVSNSNFACADTNLGTFTIEYSPATSTMFTVPDNFSSDAWYNSDLVIGAGSDYVISKLPTSDFGASITISEESYAIGSSIPFYCMSSVLTDGTVFQGTITYKLDKTAPVISEVSGIPTGWQNTDVTLTVDASDSLSGVAAYSFDGGGAWQSESTNSYSENNTIASGQIQVKDAAGNITAYSTALIIDQIDKTAPEVSWDLDTEDKADYTWHSSVVITGIASDSDSGVAAITVGLSSESGTASDDNGCGINTAGTYAVTLTATDNVGNSSSSYTLTFLVDPIIGDLTANVNTINGTTSTLDQVLTVLEWYNVLTDDQKNHIQNSTEGSEAYATLLEYWDAAQNRAVQEILDIIDAEGPTISDIEYAEDIYAKLDEEHKALIDPDAWADLIDQKDAMTVEDIIDLIPDHPLSEDCTDLDYHKATIENAMIAYEALTSSARAYVASDKVTFMRQQYALLLQLMGYTNKADSVEVIGLVERVSAASNSTISVQVKKLTDTVVENQAIAYNITLLETDSDGTTTEVQPINGETVTVKIQMESNIITDTVEIYHVLDDDTMELIGAANNLHFVTENGVTYAIFDADHFSVYAVAAEKTSITYSLPYYKITASAGTGGIVSPESANVMSGKSATLTITPADGYELSDVFLDGVSVMDAVSYWGDGRVTYTVEAVRSDHAIQAIFAPMSKTPTEQKNINFIDIDGHWAYDSIMTVTSAELMDGISDTLFDPDGEVTRAMVVTVLWRLAGEPTASTGSGFADIEEDTWYTDAVNWAAEQGVVLGYGDGTFAPEQSITRQELAMILYRYQAPDDKRHWSELYYADAADIALWALNGVGWCSSNSILSGRPDSIFDPEDTATRAELAVVLERIMEYLK